MPTPPPSQLQDKVEHLIRSDTSSGGKIGELMKLLEKARSTKAQSNPNPESNPKPDPNSDPGSNPVSKTGDCLDPDDEDCRDILSLCCQAPVRTVFGTLPVMAECQTCGQTQPLREIVLALPDS